MGPEYDLAELLPVDRVDGLCSLGGPLYVAVPAPVAVAGAGLPGHPEEGVRHLCVGSDEVVPILVHVEVLVGHAPVHAVAGEQSAGVRSLDIEGEPLADNGVAPSGVKRDVPGHVRLDCVAFLGQPLIKVPGHEHALIIVCVVQLDLVSGGVACRI